MVTGAYHFARPVPNRTLADALEEGKTFADAFNALRQQYPSASWLDPVLDVENNDYGEHPGETLGTAALSQWVEEWVSEVKQVTNVHTVIIYTDRDTAGYLNSDVATNPVWIADLSSTTSPTPPGLWSNWTFWQHTQNTILPGIGKVDEDIFNGNISALTSGFVIGKSTTPVLNVSTTSLALPSTTQGTVGATTSFTVSGSALDAECLRAVDGPRRKPDFTERFLRFWQHTVPQRRRQWYPQ